MLSIPLKVPHPCDIQAELAIWINEYSGTALGPDFTAEECSDDLVRLASLRHAVTNAISHANGYNSVMESINDCHEYHALLLQCENRRLTGIEKDTDKQNHCTLELEWDGAFAPPSRMHHTLLWERACMLWNMCAVEAYAASNQKSSSIASVKASIGHWSMAASFMRHLHEHVEQYNLYNVAVDLSPPMLLFWENIMIAQAQMSTYEFSIIKTARPSHPALARLAAGTVPVLQECLKHCRDPILTRQLPAQTHHWNTHCQALSIWFKGKAEYHEACASRSKSQWGMELARMKQAFDIIAECQRFFQRLPNIPSSLFGFDTEVGQLLFEIRERLEIAKDENDTIHRDTVPTHLPALRGQLLVKADGAIPETMMTPSIPLFRRLRKQSERNFGKQQHRSERALGQHQQRSERNFGQQKHRSERSLGQQQHRSERNLGKQKHRSERSLGQQQHRSERDLGKRYSKTMDDLVEQMERLVHEHTEAAREALAHVNLPHSLIAYKQEQSGGGLPEDLWLRVDEIQQDSRMKLIKQDLWQLREVADAARDLANQVKRQLDENEEMDRLFREQFTSFEGHNVESVQTDARAALTEYEALLAKSQAGDTVLLKRLEILDTDPKYQLLQYSKSKLDRLVPSLTVASPMYSTRKLNEMLADMSKLFDDRDAKLAKLKDRVQRSNTRTTVYAGDESSHSSQRSTRSLREARNDAQAISYDIQLNVDRQADLLDSILAENEKFTQVRRAEGAPNNSGESVIAMIDDAVEDVDFFTKHLREGLNFYSVVTPKLEQLKNQVGDISVRLTVERCDHEEESRYGDRRRKQEMSDAKMAATISSSSSNRADDMRHNSHVPPASNRSSADSRYASGIARNVVSSGGTRPGVQSISHSTPQVLVDDKKVASLIAMDFNPDKVVDALRRHNNDIELALNELLQG